MALGDYNKTIYVNGGTPAINDTNLNNNENKVKELDTSIANIASSRNFDFSLYYSRNVIQIADFQSDETWNPVLGTQSIVTTGYKIGSQMLRITEDDNVASYLYSYRDGLSLNLSLFNDGTLSSTDDYIEFVFDVSNASKVDPTAGYGITFIFETSVGNQFKKILTSGFTTGWNYLPFVKSSFTTVGSPSWANITKIYCAWNSVNNAQNEYIEFQLIDMVRKDPSTPVPNPFQRKVNGSYVADFTINSGFWFVGEEFGEIVCRNLDPTNSTGLTNGHIVGTKVYTAFTASTIMIAKTASTVYGLGWQISATDKIWAYIYSGNLYLQDYVSGSDVTTVTKAIAVAIGDIVTLKLEKSGTTVTAQTQVNNGIPVETTIETALSEAGYLSIFGAVATSQTIKSLSVSTEVEHTHHADVAESLNMPKKTWVPTLTWGTATPTGTVTTVAEYSEIGDLVFFNFSYNATDGQGATSLTISLPVTAKNTTNMFYMLKAIQGVNNVTYDDPDAYINYATPTVISFLNFATCTDNQALNVWVSGWYRK